VLRIDGIPDGLNGDRTQLPTLELTLIAYENNWCSGLTARPGCSWMNRSIDGHDANGSGIKWRMSESSKRNSRTCGEFDIRQDEAVTVSTPFDVRP